MTWFVETSGYDMAKREGSPKNSLAKSDWKKIGKGAIWAALGGILGYLTSEVVPFMKENQNEWATAFGFVVSVLSNVVSKYRTDTQKTFFSVLLALGLCGTVEAQQVMPAEQERVLRSYIPKLEDNPAIKAKLDQAFLYDSKTIPPAHQFQPIIGGQGTDYTVFYSPFAQLNSSREPTNPNNEFPWTAGTGGGLHLVPKDRRYEFKLMWLPPKPDGGMWPVAVYRGPLDKSHSVNMPVPKQGWRWVFPVGTIFGEVLMKNFADGKWATYEVRLRLREQDDWDFEVYRPDIELPQFVRVTKKRLTDANHDRPAFDRTAIEHVLPPIPNARELLWSAKFIPIRGSDTIIPTAQDDENIVPRNYLGHFLTDCRDCHKDVMRHADATDSRDWYGNTEGSNGIFSWHPVDPSSIGPPDKTVRLRRDFIESGMVEMYDPAKHPSEIYTEIPFYENAPASRYPNSGRRTIRG